MEIHEREVQDRMTMVVFHTDERRAALTRFRERNPLIVQLVRYVAVSGLATAVNALVYLTVRTWWDPIPANLLALGISTLVSTEANRRFTFGGVHTRRWRAHVQTAGTVAFYAVYSSAVLIVLAMVVERPTPLLETAAVAAASVLGGIGRFLLLRFWVFRGEDGPVVDPGPMLSHDEDRSS